MPHRTRLGQRRGPKPPERDTTQSQGAEGGPIPPALFTSSPTGALPVALSPINPLLYLRVFSSLTGRPPRTHYPLLAQTGVNQRSHSLPNTESSLITSQRYVKRNSLAALIKRLTRSQITPLKSVPIIRSPCHTPSSTASPPFHRSPFCRWQIIVTGLGRNKPNQVDVCLSYATSRNDC